jgi:L-threonylcarbamoyladenylate synthase
MKNKLNTDQIIFLLKQGAIIACPTEGVWGLSCDPLNQQAVQRLLALKKRSVEKGLILITDNWENAKNWMDLSAPNLWKKIQLKTERPTTWILPASPIVPSWIRGEHTSIAVRCIQHPVAQSICAAFGSPLISTSANLSGESPCLTLTDVEQQFGNQIDYIVPAKTQGINKPSQIVEALTGKILRD